ncbi:MAG: biosynthetic arginine decarboxylase, partial [Zetaproteobacteria bacterium]
MGAETMSWTVADADALYGVSRWGKGVFAVNARGEIEVAAGGMRASLFEIVQTLIREHDIWPPVLLRFPEVIAERMDKLFSAFAEAREEAGYQGRYFGVYPIKVNQQAQVVESIAQLGRRYGWGLEVGSKPELHAAIAMLEHVSGPIVCNGYKDAEFVYLALLARKLGRDVYIVIEKLSELETVLEMARKTGVRPLLGVRCRLSVMPDGFWRESGGDASKFGLSAAEALRCVEMLKREGMLDSLKLLHFHMGSQIPRIQHLKAALREIARYYVELRRLGAPIAAIDVGGGLGVDYEGTFSGDPSSVDYTIGEYASNVIWEIKAIADEAGLPHPDILSESGRALVA